jgi:hypothetical protein
MLLLMMMYSGFLETGNEFFNIIYVSLGLKLNLTPYYIMYYGPCNIKQLHEISNSFPIYATLPPQP